MRKKDCDVQRHIKRNELKTEKRIEQYKGVKALLDTWEAQPEDVRVRHRNDILKLRARVRVIRNSLLCRAQEIEI